MNEIVMSSLFTPYHPTVESSPLWEKTINNTRLYCRHTWLEKDVSTITRWITLSAGEHLAPNIHQGVWRHIEGLAASDFAQPFSILLGDQLLFQVDMVSVLYTEVGIFTHDIKPEDYCLYFHHDPEVHAHAYQSTALMLLLDWLQSEGFWRLWAIVGDKPESLGALLQVAGFDYLKTIDQRLGTSLYYFDGP